MQALGRQSYSKLCTRCQVDNDLPKPAQEIFQDSYDKAIANGDDSKTAKRYAYQCLALAGWVKTERGWECNGPDVRDKVTHRKAVRQPDGSYLIENVEIPSSTHVEPIRLCCTP